MGDQEEAERLYNLLRNNTEDQDTWSMFVITAHERFEKIMRRKPTRRRKLYNGKLACTYFQYLGPRPPRRKPSEIEESHDIPDQKLDPEESEN
jgi:putative N6-adenine-specific DNA methylase